jgi:ribosomal protein S6--L-glutamate ligase
MEKMIKNDMKILSFHLLLETEWNRILNGNSLSDDDIAAIKSADGVILPQGCSERVYRTACEYCERVFPNYDARFRFPGKTGQAQLFEERGVSMPQTYTFQNVDHFTQKKQSCFPYPFVFKSAWGGAGRKVFLVQSDDDLDRCLGMARTWESENEPGIVLQEYIDTGGRSLRVVVIEKSMYAYWRVQTEKDNFYTNYSKGATIDSESYPLLQEKACHVLKPFCLATGINLAGFDFIFAENKKNQEPLFLEINYGFGTFGLGGPDKYLKLLESGIREWKENF